MQPVEEMDVEEPEVTSKKTKNETLPGTINCFGFGSDHDPNMLKEIAQHGGGIYYFIQNNDNIPEAFADCLGGLLSVAAQNISIKIEAPENVQIKKVLTKLNLKEVKAGKSYEVQIGDIQSEEQRDIIAVTQLPQLQSEASSFPICTVSLSYFNVITSTMESSECVAQVARPQIVPEGQKVHYELDKQHNRLISAEAMEKATKEGNSGRLEQARSVLKEALEHIKSSASVSDEFCQSLIKDLQLCMQGLQDQHVFEQQGNKMLMNNYAAQANQRSSNVQMASQQVYQTSARSQMQQQFSSVSKKR
jgi:hypothetical protein